MGVGGGRAIFSPLANNLTSRRSKKYGLLRVEIHIYKNCTQHMYDKRLSQPPEVPNRNNKWKQGASGSLSGFWMSAIFFFILRPAFWGVGSKRTTIRLFFLKHRILRKVDRLGPKLAPAARIQNLASLLHFWLSGSQICHSSHTLGCPALKLAQLSHVCLV